jgi:hypothetical protein
LRVIASTTARRQQGPPLVAQANPGLAPPLPGKNLQ